MQPETCVRCVEFALILENIKKILRVVVRAFFFRGSRNLQARLNLTGTVVLVTPLQLEDTPRIAVSQLTKTCLQFVMLPQDETPGSFKQRSQFISKSKKKVDVARNKELVRLCIVACYPETLEIGGALEDRNRSRGEDSCFGGSFQVQLLVP